MIRPALEGIIWSDGSSSGLFSNTDVELLEQVQQRATKMIKGLENLTYNGGVERAGTSYAWI